MGVLAAHDPQQIPLALSLRRARPLATTVTTSFDGIATTILIIPITLGTVLVAEGMLNYFGPRGWLNRVLLEIGLADSPLRLIHNYWGVFFSLVITSPGKKCPTPTLVMNDLW